MGFTVDKCIYVSTRAYNGEGKHREETRGLISSALIHHAVPVDKAD